MAALSAPEQGPPGGQLLMPGRLLAWGVFPIALMQRNLLSWPDPALWRPLVVYMVLVLVWGAVSGAFRNSRAWVPGWPVWLFLAALLGLQGFAMWTSAVHWKCPPIEAIGTYGHLLSQVIVLMLYTLGLRLLCASSGGAASLVQGAVFSLVLLLGVCGVQFAWLITGPEVWDWLMQSLGQPKALDSVGKHVVSLHGQLERGLIWSGEWLEADVSFHQNPLSANGSYTLTSLHINGVFATTSDLAVALAVAYTPLLLAGMSVAGAWRKHLLGLLAVAVVIILLGGRTIQAVAACVFALAWFSRRVLWQPGGRMRALLVMGIVLGLCAGAMANDSMGRRLASRVLESGSTVLPEEVVARELWSLVQDHPWTGVGYGWSSSYVVNGEQYTQAARADGASELRAWREDVQGLPTPSLLLEFLAVFGIPLALAGASSFAWLWWWLRRLAETGARTDNQRRFALAACMPYSTAVIVFALFDMDFSNPLLFLPALALWSMVRVWKACPVEPAKGGGADSGSGKSLRPAGLAGSGGPAQPAKKAGSLISNSPTRPFTMSG